MTEKTFKEVCEEFCQEMLIEADRLALKTFEVGTPIYNFQQSLIKNAATYRLAKLKDEDNAK